MSYLSEFDLYRSLVAIPSSLVPLTLEEYFPIITPADIDVGRIQRYFARQANFKTGEILEISERTFQKIRTNKFFKSIEMTWRIAGPLDDLPAVSGPNNPARAYTGVRTANQLSLNEAEKELPGMQYKIRHMTQLYQDK